MRCVRFDLPGSADCDIMRLSGLHFITTQLRMTGFSENTGVRRRRAMRIAVCDDDEQEISRIGKLLKKYEDSRGEAFDCRYFTNSTDFLCEFKGGEYDLVLLDVRMPGAGGIQAAQEMRKRDRNVRLIFVSSSLIWSMQIIFRRWMPRGSG